MKRGVTLHEFYLNLAPYIIMVVLLPLAAFSRVEIDGTVIAAVMAAIGLPAAYASGKYAKARVITKVSKAIESSEALPGGLTTEALLQLMPYLISLEALVLFAGGWLSVTPEDIIFIIGALVGTGAVGKAAYTSAQGTLRTLE
jgi:hypothetical protein